ncbi:hypothetical protein A5625_24800 [Mycobacterium sp. 1465703.0]|nr:hypothetical protein A5625_08815 [Mycobacterium sp. 1465703.0]OBJ01742.1 hypothetical protein A5625_24800 [Mycobacterium sp. 1465703.0]
MLKVWAAMRGAGRVQTVSTATMLERQTPSVSMTCILLSAVLSARAVKVGRVARLAGGQLPRMRYSARVVEVALGAASLMRGFD